MKKFIAILLVVLLAFAFVSCGKGECDLCGQTASLKKLTYDGESGKFCKDCYDFAKSMTEFAASFGY
jgi:hypothetical protein